MALIMDTSGLISLLERVNRPSLIQDLRTLHGDIIVPHAVKEEFEVKSRALDRHIANNEIKIVTTATLKGVALFKKAYPTLGRGETDVILYGLHLQNHGIDSMCVLDDRDARHVAKINNLNFTGMLGLLKTLEVKGFLRPPDYYEIIKTLKNSGIYLTKDMLDTMTNTP